MSTERLAAVVVFSIVSLFAGGMVFDAYLFMKTGTHYEIPPVLITAFAASGSGAAYWMFKREKK